MKINKKIIKELSDYLDEFNLSEIEYTEKDTKIKVSKNNISVSNNSLPINNNQETSSEIFASGLGEEITFGVGKDGLFTDILFFETLIFVSLTVYSNSVRLNSSKYSVNSLIIFLSIFIFLRAFA